MINRLNATRHTLSIVSKFRRSTLLGIGAAVLAGAVATPIMANASPEPTAHATHAAAVAEPQAKHAAAKPQVTHTAAKPQVKHAAAKPQLKRPSAKRAVPSMKQLSPRPVTAPQAGFKPTKTQMANARKIIETGQKKHLKPRAWVIALATASQESGLRNLGNLGANNDHDSLGLFQQRPSSGWGTPKQVTNPEHAASSFYNALTHVHNWDKLPATVAAQSVQVSAFPDHYAKWEKQATNLVLATYGVGPFAHIPGAHS